MRFIFVLALIFAALSPASAQSYQDKKDADAVALIASALAKVDKNPALFDGAQIPATADLKAVQTLLDRMTIELKAATSGFSSLSSKASQRPDVVKLRAKYDDLTRYRNALAPAYARGEDNAGRAAIQKRSDRQAAVIAANQACDAFDRDPDHRNTSNGELQTLLEMLRVGRGGWGTAEEGKKYIAAIDSVAKVCAKPEHANVKAACNHHKEPQESLVHACDLPAKKTELLQMAVKELIAHHMKYSDTPTPEKLAGAEGWIDVKGVSSYSDYFSGKATRKLLDGIVSPMLAQANMTGKDADVLFESLAAQNAALEAKVRELAPTWELPGEACTGGGCSAAKKFVSQWYSGAKIIQLRATKPNWTVTHHKGMPYRYRGGYALVQVKGDPFCQLRAWTITEQYRGGGRYVASSDVELGYVRWQRCK